MKIVTCYIPERLSHLADSDYKKISEARNFLLEFLAREIEKSNEILEYKIDYSIDKKNDGCVITHTRVHFEGAARLIQEKCIRLVENRVDDALRFSELLMRCALYDPERKLDLTIYDGEELHEYLEIFALNKCRVEKIKINFDLGI